MGSEMCIRDRDIVVREHHALGPSGGAAGVDDGGEVAALHPGLITCLLYTSDAADERSSVDLGGRRIIQKKKTV